MLTIDQNKWIAKELGLPWDQGAAIGFKFDTREGFHLIIENGPVQDWWDEFILMNPHVFVIFYNMTDPAKPGGWAIKQDYLGPKLSVELSKWLGGEKK